MHLKLLDFKANVIFMEKHVGKLSHSYSKHIGRMEYLLLITRKYFISWSKGITFKRASVKNVNLLEW